MNTIVCASFLLISGYLGIAGGESWDTLQIFSSPYPLRRLTVSSRLKGEMDDTTRIFLCDTSFAYLLTDTARFAPMRIREENLGRIGSGYNSFGSGDLDSDRKWDLVLGRITAPYNILRFYWTGTSWQGELIGTLTEPIYDLDVGDCNNDGKDEVLLGCYNSLRIARWTISGWEIITVLNNTREIKGVTIGNFDPTLPGKEIGATFFDGKVRRIHWNGNSWDTLTIFSNSNTSLTEIISGDFDNASPGEEIAVLNGRSPSTNGAVIEIYYSGIWNSRVIFRPTVDTRYIDLTIGDFYDGSSGKELATITEYGGDNHCRIIYGSGNNWQSSVIHSLDRTYFGVKAGDINRHRFYNEEIVTTVWRSLYLIQQYKASPPVITNINQLPFPLPGEILNINCKIYTDFDSLRYISDTLYFSQDGISFYPIIHDSFRLRDSTFFYSIPPGDSGERFFYYIKAFNRFGLFTQSPLKIINLGYPRRIREIQYTTDPSGISPDTNKWVITSGIVSGVFGEDFFMEDPAFFGFRGIFVRSSFPNLLIGDSVKISGRVLEINHLTTIRMDIDSGSSLLILRRGVSISPQLVFLNQIAESLEGSLLKVDSLHFKERGIFEGNRGYWAYNLTESESCLVRIEPGTNIPGMAIPETPFMIIGNISQSGSNFQILPRFRSDFLIYPPGIEETFQRIVEKSPPVRLELFDALGRKVKGRFSPGIYFLKSQRSYKMVIILSDFR